MKLLLLLMALSALLPSLPLEGFLVKIGQPLNQICLEWTNLTKTYKPIYQALVCGQPLLPGSLQDSFRQTGLIHLMVVSGAHLIFLERLILKFFPSHSALQRLAWPFLFLYVLNCLCRPPVMRAFISLALHQICLRKGLNWNPQQRVLYTGGLLLVLFPQWWNSFSFFLSWCASLAISLPFQSLWKKHLFIYLFLSGPLQKFTSLHPFSVLSNFLLAPLIFSWAFPLSFLSLIVPPLIPLMDLFWLYALKLLNLVAPSFYMPPQMDLWIPSSFLLWIYLFLFHGGLQAYFVTEKRRLYELKARRLA